MEYADSLWAHLGGDSDTDVTTQSEVDSWLEKILAEAEDSNLDINGVDGEPLAETTWNATARRIIRTQAIMARTATGEPDFIEAARRIVANKTYETVDGILFDGFSASAVLQVYDALGDEMKERMAALGLAKAVNVAFKIMRSPSVSVSSRTAADKYRVTQDVGSPGKWVVQKYYPDNQLYHDVGDPVDSRQAAEEKLRQIQSEGSRRQAGAPTIMGPDAALKAAPKEEQQAYWNFVGQGAADSDSGWYVPLDFNSWRRSYWDDTKGDTSYAPGLPPMASARRTAAEEWIKECYGCGYIQGSDPSLDDSIMWRGFNAQCPRCGSYEVHTWQGGYGRNAQRTAAADESYPHVILKVTGGARSLAEVEAYLYRGWKAQQVEDGTIYISGHDIPGFGMVPLRDRLMSGLIGTEIIGHTGSDEQPAVSRPGQGVTWASRTAADDDDELIDWEKWKRDREEGLIDPGPLKQQTYQKELKTHIYSDSARTAMERGPVYSEDDARQTAIDWQHWVSEQNLSWGEMAEWGAYFEELAERFGLIDEFQENGII